ncbi:MAG TPA: beta-hydroxyacyl-ACP dehydratase [Deltaproteobacteria bacterium]|nr:beta-hydroxyacyl-ACP dehydratase [Deltaproteobacteria bacterium]
MRYLLVDRIVEAEAGRSIKGVKNVAMSEDFLEFHFPENPILPGVMLIEAMAQLAGWLEASGSDFTRWALVSEVRQANFYGFAYPGDRVELSVEVRGGDGRRREYGATAFVDGRRKARASFAADVVELADLEDPALMRRRYAVLRR